MMMKFYFMVMQLLLLIMFLESASNKRRDISGYLVILKNQANMVGRSGIIGASRERRKREEFLDGMEEAPPEGSRLFPHDNTPATGPANAPGKKGWNFGSMFNSMKQGAANIWDNVKGFFNKIGNSLGLTVRKPETPPPTQPPAES